MGSVLELLKYFIWFHLSGFVHAVSSDQMPPPLRSPLPASAQWALPLPLRLLWRTVSSWKCSPPLCCALNLCASLKLVHCFLFWFLDTISQIGLYMLFSYLSPSQDWASWGLLVISTSFTVYPETQLRADSYLVSDKSFFDYWINPYFLLFQSIIASCSSWVSSRQDCITKYRMGFPYSSISNSFPILTSLHETYTTY